MIYIVHPTINLFLHSRVVPDNVNTEIFRSLNSLKSTAQLMIKIWRHSEYHPVAQSVPSEKCVNAIPGQNGGTGHNRGRYDVQVCVIRLNKPHGLL